MYVYVYIAIYVPTITLYLLAVLEHPTSCLILLLSCSYDLPYLLPYDRLSVLRIGLDLTYTRARGTSLVLKHP